MSRGIPSRSRLLLALAVALLLVSPAYAPIIECLGLACSPAEDLIAWFPFNGNADDESGHGHHAEVFGATLVEDRAGNPDSAYSFDGDFDYLVVPPSLDWYLGTGDFTINLWFKGPPQVTSAPTTFLGQWDCRDREGDWVLAFGRGEEAGLLRLFWVPYGCCAPGIVGGKIVTDDEWHMITLRRKSGTIDLYVDARLDASRSDHEGRVFGNPSLATFIGTYECRVNQNTASITGVLDDIRIYERALEEAELRELFAPPLARINELIEQVQSLDLHHGIENGLLAKLNAALLILGDLDVGNDHAAANVLGAFIRQVQAQSAKKIAADDAEALIDAAEEIIELLSGDMRIRREEFRRRLFSPGKRLGLGPRPQEPE